MRSLPSKGIRELLIDGLNVWLQVPELNLQKIRKIILMLHTSSLMYHPFALNNQGKSNQNSRLDDIEDGSRLRRGMPSAHMIYGESQTINSASYVQICALAETLKLSNPISVSVFCGQSGYLLNCNVLRC